MKNEIYREVINDNTDFIPKRFLKGVKDWEKVRKKLEEEFAKISELPAQSDGDRVTSSNLSDLTVQTAIKREEILEKSQKLIAKIEMLDYGLSHLKDDEREVLEQYYFSGKTKDAVTYQLSMKFAKSERSVYYWKNDILDKFGEVIVEHYSL